MLLKYAAWSVRNNILPGHLSPWDTPSKADKKYDTSTVAELFLWFENTVTVLFRATHRNAQNTSLRHSVHILLLHDPGLVRRSILRGDRNTLNQNR